MLEIILVVFLGKKVAGILKAKGRKPGLFVFALVAFWIVGEILGAIIGVVATDGENAGMMYLCAIVGAALGAVLAFVLANAAAPGPQPAGTFTGGFPVTPHPPSPQYSGQTQYPAQPPRTPPWQQG